MIKKLVIVLALIMSAGVSPAQAEMGYRYWSYWLYDGGWEMSQEGAGTHIPKDGDLEGWRYISVSGNADLNYAPRTNATFEDICGSTPKKDGIVRVGLVIDYGMPSDYPEGAEVPSLVTQCSELVEGDPSTKLLGSHAIRSDQDMICGIDNLPETGCGEEVDLTPPSKSNEIPTLQIGGLAIIALILGAWKSRRKKK